MRTIPRCLPLLTSTKMLATVTRSSASPTVFFRGTRRREGITHTSREVRITGTRLASILVCTRFIMVKICARRPTRTLSPRRRSTTLCASSVPTASSLRGATPSRNSFRVKATLGRTRSRGCARNSSAIRAIRTACSRHTFPLTGCPLASWRIGVARVGAHCDGGRRGGDALAAGVHQDGPGPRVNFPKKQDKNMGDMTRKEKSGGRERREEGRERNAKL